MKKWSPDKITALVLILSCVYLLCSGIDGEVKSILTISAGYLFATGVLERQK